MTAIPKSAVTRRDTMENEDILYLPHYRSKKRKPMSAHDRAAQFGAFAALTGYEDAVEETARRTDCKIEIDETVKEEINYRLVFLAEGEFPSPCVSITYFVKDEKKPGGKYVTLTGSVIKIDSYTRTIRMEDMKEISIDDILSVDGEIFDERF